MASRIIIGGESTAPMGQMYLDMLHRARMDSLAENQFAAQQQNADRDYRMRLQQQNQQRNQGGVPGAARMAAQRGQQQAQDMAMNQWAAERQDRNSQQQWQRGQAEREAQQRMQMASQARMDSLEGRDMANQLQRDQMDQRGGQFQVEQSAQAAALASREAEAARNRETDNLRWNADRESREGIANDNRGYQEWQKTLALHQQLSGDLDRKYAPIMDKVGPEADAARAAYAQEKSELGAILRNGQKNAAYSSVLGDGLAMGGAAQGGSVNDAVMPQGGPRIVDNAVVDSSGADTGLPPPVKPRAMSPATPSGESALSRALQAETLRKRQAGDQDALDKDLGRQSALGKNADSMPWASYKQTVSDYAKANGWDEAKQAQMLEAHGQAKEMKTLWESTAQLPREERIAQWQQESAMLSGNIPPEARKQIALANPTMPPEQAVQKYVNDKMKSYAAQGVDVTELRSWLQKKIADEQRFGKQDAAQAAAEQTRAGDEQLRAGLRATQDDVAARQADAAARKAGGKKVRLYSPVKGWYETTEYEANKAAAAGRKFAGR